MCGSRAYEGNTVDMYLTEAPPTVSRVAPAATVDAGGVWLLGVAELSKRNKGQWE